MPEAVRLIEMHELTRVYQLGPQEIYALRGVTLNIEPGEYVAIMGPSGSGKSTLMNIIGCLDTPNAGEYWLNGTQVSKMSDDALARGNSWKLWKTKPISRFRTSASSSSLSVLTSRPCSL